MKVGLSFCQIFFLENKTGSCYIHDVVVGEDIVYITHAFQNETDEFPIFGDGHPHTKEDGRQRWRSQVVLGFKPVEDSKFEKAYLEQRKPNR